MFYINRKSAHGYTAQRKQTADIEKAEQREGTENAKNTIYKGSVNKKTSNTFQNDFHQKPLKQKLFGA